MQRTIARWRWLAALVLLAGLLAGLEVLGQLAGGSAGLAGALVRLAFLAAALGLLWLLERLGRGPLLVGGAALAGALLLALLLPDLTAAGWLALLLWNAGLVVLAGVWRASRLRWPVLALLALLAGAVPALWLQLLGRFSDEEFFVAVQVVALAAIWLVLFLLSRLLPRRAAPLPPRRWLGRGLLAALVLALLVGAGGVLRAYQASFYPTEAPGFAGITPEQPFMCGVAAEVGPTYDGMVVFRGMLAELAQRPDKSVVANGMLAVASGERQPAEAFRSQLLAEASAGTFTGPANSVKYIQYEAAQRLYFYSVLRQRLPDLFSAADETALRSWFAAINRRALTVEWVDWLYASALGASPEGPYENQESGAGLLALLEATGMADPALSAANRSYLERNPRGWQQRFRVTDDAVIYQPEWITNAIFQQMLVGEASPERVRQSFRWLLLQALPDGTALRYNYPYAANMTSVAYLGADMTSDPDLIWLAGRSLEASIAQGKPIPSQIGITGQVAGSASSPSAGSCLLYGDSGMPNQQGPLAPDKLVLRDGWASSSLYTMLDLRFTGWHRYKATNALTLVYQGQPLVAEQLEQQAFAWLPKGRSFFRDKRVPRENLNGFVVAKTGLSAALASLSGVGGPWAQDVPFYATVEHFATSSDRDTSRTTIRGWHGWQQQRDITLLHSGLLVVEDQASGPAGTPAAVIWNLVGQPSATTDTRLTLAGGAELVTLDMGGGGVVRELNSEQPALRVQEASGQLHTVSIFLTQQWRGAQVELVQNAIQISANGQQVQIPLNI